MRKNPLALSTLSTLLTLSTLCPFPTLTAQAIEDFKFEVTTLGGQTLTQEDFTNSVLLIDYWGTWCGPCRKAVPVLEDLYAKYKQHGLEIIGLNYENVPEAQALDLVRKTAGEFGITYHLALGTPALKRQVPGFRGYPTMLFFKKGMVFDHQKVGFAPEMTGDLEAWIRGALGLAVEAVGADPDEVAGGRRAPDPAAGPGGADEQDEPEPIPAGTIFKPGDGDTGFSFEAEDVDGEKLKFDDLRGKPVILVLTSTWDGEAVNASKVLSALHEELSPKGVHVIAACLERQKQSNLKIAAIKAFRQEHGLKYRMFPAGLELMKKIYMFSGMPLYLVFDQEGVLVLREMAAEDIQTTVQERVAGLLD